MELALCLILALVWGGIWAATLQWTTWGRFLAARRAWLAVVVGVGVDLLILLALLPILVWLSVCAVIGASAVGIVIRSIGNEWGEHAELLRTVRGASEVTRWRHGDEDPAGE